VTGCGAIGGMQIVIGNRSTRRKPAPVSPCPPQIPHDLTCARPGPPRWKVSDWPSELWHDLLSNLMKHLSFFLWRYSPNLGLGLPPWNSPFHFGLLALRHSVGLLGRVISSSQGLCLYTNTEKCTYTHKHQTSMPWVGFETTILASEWAKTVHDLDRSATVTGHTGY
jgi:hypothetical protein